ncbi:PAQR family membrane homeostasis protein TrhA [Collinsella stercoris]|uniref:PAQR family membrane homeostasis protein TrhA n=1 Tax=Collinsella stercoris TaxID=147206 RepID=UPI00248E9AA5|nr:hemolysin III family protein [Collinsella stercoris]
MPDTSDSLTPRPDVAAAPVPIARADAASRAQRLLHAAESGAKGAAVTVGAPVKAAARAIKRHVPPQYTLGEEIANSITHGIGAALGVAALVVMIVKAAVAGSHPASLASAIIFGIALILEYLASTLYHAIAPAAAKRVFRIIDHSCIYVLIAGTYTPFCLITLADAGGIPLCIAVWALAVAGILFEVFMRQRQSRWLTIAVYLVMGWLVVFRLPQLLELLHPTALILLAAGGLCYTAGTAFYVLKKIRYMHSIFHVWVLAGSVLQFLAVVLFVI